MKTPTPEASAIYSEVGVYSGQGKTFAVLMISKPFQAKTLRDVNGSFTEKADVGGAYCGRATEVTACYRQLDGGVLSYVSQNPSGSLEEGAQMLQAVYDSLS
ncbi:MAG: hypothetical protein Q4G45_14195 [Actinomycetia bacterium]|nr:hypothetical protein [Actinomycetes bacterium]